MQLSNLLYTSYWFSQPYIARGATAWAWISIFLALVLIGIVAQIVRSTSVDQLKQEVLRKVSLLTLTFGLLGLIWFFLRQERIPFLAWRFWLLLWVLGFVWWAASTLRYILKRVPQIRSEHAERAKRDKYLPKPSRG